MPIRRTYGIGFEKYGLNERFPLWDLDFPFFLFLPAVLLQGSKKSIVRRLWKIQERLFGTAHPLCIRRHHPGDPLRLSSAIYAESNAMSAGICSRRANDGGPG